MPANFQRQCEQISDSYVLMTAAHNEEAFVEGLIQSVLAQTILPLKWVIVSDNSSDRTDSIVKSYAERHRFIHFVRINRAQGRNFGAKVRALRKGYESLANLSYDFIGNLDADLSLEPSYFENLIGQFHRDARLGIVGGFVYEDSGFGYVSRRFNDVRNVAHAAQLVRRECYEAIGGYPVLKYGGEDWYAQTNARMLGWRVESFPHAKIFHHRHTGSTSNGIQNAFRLGRMDYEFGSDLLFEVFKCARRWNERPFCLSSLSRFAGFVWPYVIREHREVPAEVRSFLRDEQRQRLSSMLKSFRAGNLAQASR